MQKDGFADTSEGVLNDSANGALLRSGINFSLISQNTELSISVL